METVLSIIYGNTECFRIQMFFRCCDNRMESTRSARVALRGVERSETQHLL